MMKGKIKRVLVATLLLFVCSCILSPPVTASFKLWAYSGLTGGVMPALDEIPTINADDSKNAHNNDGALGWDGSVFRSYRYDSSETTSESSPNYIIPDDNVTSTGAWVLQASEFAPIADPTFTGEIGIGAVNVSETELGILEGLTASTAELNYSIGVSGDIQTALDARCLESIFGDAIEADDFQLNGTTLELVAQIPHTDATQTWLANQTFGDGVGVIFGAGTDFHAYYDEAGSDELEGHFNFATDKVFNLINDGAGDAYFEQNGNQVVDVGDIVTASDFGVMVYTSAGNLTTGAQNATFAADHTLTDLEQRGSTIIFSATGTALANLVTADDEFCAESIGGAFDIFVDVNGSDSMYLDGVLLDAGDKAYSPGAAGDLICCEEIAANTWKCNSNGWTDED